MTYSPHQETEDFEQHSEGQLEHLAAAEELPPRFMVRLPQRRPYVVYTILGVTIFVYLLQMATSQGFLDLAGWRCPHFYSLDLPVCYGLKINEFILTGQYWRLLAPILLHASLLHIGFNMYALYVLGPNLESHFGHWQFLALYVVSGFAGFVASFLLTAAPSLGASTAIFGLLAAQAVFIYRNQHIFGARARIVLRNILNIAVINFIIGLSPGIDNWGHFGGLLGGALFAWIAAPDYRVVGEGPEFTLSDQNGEYRALLAAVVTASLFAFLTATFILSRVLR